MIDSIRLLSLTIVGAAFLSAGDAGAHGESNATLFVAEHGIDSGRCLEETAPCQSLSYALSIAGKGAQIRVAQGSYPVENPQDLFHVVSGMIDVQGGFEMRGQRFSGRTGVSVLTGVPPQYQALLESRGFDVVYDRNALEGWQTAEAEKFIGLYDRLKSGAAASPCTDGMAGDLSCDSVDLLAHFSLADVSAGPSSANDVWGFVDLNTGREYAIVGYDIGTAVIDLSVPENPLEVGFINGQTAFWRDIKVYQFFDSIDKRWRAYAYVTADRSTDGLVVIDMSDLPHAIRKVDYAGDFEAAHNVYATNTDYSTGVALADATPLLVIAGSNLDSGQFRAYSLADPAAPEFVAGAGSPDYMHDASSFIITDSRKDSQCVNGSDWCEVLLDFNEETVDLWDITVAANPQRLSRTSYDGAAYVHSGWWSEDKQYMFVHDEQDEQLFGLNTTLRVFSIVDLGVPVLSGKWEGTSSAIDHNGYVRGNRYYMSNYSRGLTVLDISDPTSPVTTGSLDTYPFSDTSGFVGAWGTYPFFFSGIVAVSDIDTGLYVAQDRSLDVPQGSFSFSASSYAGEEGTSAQLVVRRTGGSSDSVSVEFQAVHATANEDDYQLVFETLLWAAGDTSDRVIDIPLVNDGLVEGLERLLVRLVNPGGGATLGYPNVASVFISDPGAAAEIGFFADSVEVAERGFATAVLVLQRSGSAVGAASVHFAVSGGDAIAGSDFVGASAGTVTWDAGDGEPKNLLFSIIDDGSNEDIEFFTVALTSASGATIRGPSTARVHILDNQGLNVARGGSGGGSAWGLLILLAATTVGRGAALRHSKCRKGGALQSSDRAQGLLK
jgi:choice-of-anchor B domain-containing protein